MYFRMLGCLSVTMWLMAMPLSSSTRIPLLKPSSSIAFELVVSLHCIKMKKKLWQSIILNMHLFSLLSFFLFLVMLHWSIYENTTFCPSIYAQVINMNCNYIVLLETTKSLTLWTNTWQLHWAETKFHNIPELVEDPVHVSDLGPSVCTCHI